MKRRILSIVLLAALVIGLLPQGIFSVSANDDDIAYPVEGGNVYFDKPLYDMGIGSVAYCDGTITKYVDALGHQYENGVCSACGEKSAALAFSDIPANEWYVDAVDYAVRNGLMNGVGNDRFAPEGSMTRAMLVTVLWRYEGEPAEGENSFTDVPNGTWYTDAVAWAAANGIVSGVGNGKFDPEGSITREQMAAILFRYAGKKCIDTSKRGDLSGFPDSGKISAWAKDAMQWTVAEQIINGSDGKLLPQGNATRAQVAAILMRFIENIVKNKQTAARHTEVLDPAVPATCTEKGKTEGKHCAVCGTVIVAQEELPALGHDYGAWTQTKAPTCTEKGEEKCTCSRCDAFETREVESTGHTEVIDPAVAATCTQAGKTEGKHCSACNTVLVAQETVAALGHDFGEWIQTKAPTCTEKGEEKRTCSRCDAFESREIAAHGHTEVIDAAVPATCTENGKTEGKRCSTCNTVLVAQKTVAALGHDYGAWTQTKAPTCTEKGEEKRTCSRCDAFETREIAAHGHTEVIDAAVPATCTEKGKTEGKHCTVCGTVIVAQKTVAALGHDYGAWTQIKAPTCTEKGEEKRTCSRCDAFETREIAAHGH
ncbi:MAG: S-layer homology domain-containing protein, partial [Faecousia sp.]